MSWFWSIAQFVLAFWVGWWLRGLRDEDLASLAELEKFEERRWAEKAKKMPKSPKDYPYP